MAGSEFRHFELGPNPTIKLNRSQPKNKQFGLNRSVHWETFGYVANRGAPGRMMTRLSIEAFCNSWGSGPRMS